MGSKLLFIHIHWHMIFILRGQGYFGKLTHLLEGEKVDFFN